MLVVRGDRDEKGLMAVPAHQGGELVLRNPGEQGRARDLVAVQMQDRQHGAVATGVEQLVRMPARGQRAGLRLAVAYDARDEQVGIVEGGSVSVCQRIAELAAL